MTDSECILLFKNESDSHVQVFFYYKWDKVNGVSKKSIFVQPHGERLYQEETPFKYQVEARILNGVLYLINMLSFELVVMVT